MNLSKETILRLAGEAGLSKKGVEKLTRDLELIEEGMGMAQPAPIQPTFVPQPYIEQPWTWPGIGVGTYPNDNTFRIGGVYVGDPPGSIGSGGMFTSGFVQTV